MMLAGFIIITLIYVLLVTREADSNRRFMRDSLQELRSIVQTTLIHARAKTVDEAVIAQTHLETEQKALEEAQSILENEVTLPKGKLMGFRGSDNKIYKFATPPPESILSKIPKEKLIYESIDQRPAATTR